MLSAWSQRLLKTRITSPILHGKEAEPTERPTDAPTETFFPLYCRDGNEPEQDDGSEPEHGDNPVRAGG